MRSLIKPLLQLARCSSGSALVESAFAMPIAIFLMVGIVDFGMAFTTWATGSKSVRDAARYLGSLPPAVMKDPTDPTGATWLTDCPSWAKTNAENLAVKGNIAGSGSALVPNWQVSGGANNNITVDCSTLPSIIVAAKFPFSPVMPFVSFTFTVTLSAQHTERSVGG